MSIVIYLDAVKGEDGATKSLIPVLKVYQRGLLMWFDRHNSYYDEYWYDFKEYKALKKDYDKLQKECEKLKADNKALKVKVKELRNGADTSDYEKQLKLLDSKSVKIALKFRAFYIRILKAFKIKK